MLFSVCGFLGFNYYPFDVPNLTERNILGNIRTVENKDKKGESERKREKKRGPGRKKRDRL